MTRKSTAGTCAFIGALLAVGLSGCGGGDGGDLAPSQKLSSSSISPARGRPSPPPEEKPLAEQVASFSSGYEGWEGDGISVVDYAAGNPLPSLALRNDMWFAEFSTRSPAWMQVLKTGRRVVVSVDVHTRDILYLGAQVERPLQVEFRDYTTPNFPYPYTSVSATIGTIKRDPNPKRWNHLEIEIADTQTSALPVGWTGFGAEDAQGNPVLPEGRTFANVLANATEIALTTKRPGYVSGFLQWDVSIDNVRVQAYDLRTSGLQPR